MQTNPRSGRLQLPAATASKLVTGLVSALVFALALPVHGQQVDEHTDPDPHAAHRAMMSPATTEATYRVAHAEYAVPDLVLQDEHGKPVRLRQLFSSERPVAVNFIFTSCSTICPVMTATMLQLQRELGDLAVKPLFVSISIDPDFDNSSVLDAYAQRFGADWTFLTGDRADVLNVLQSFSAWRGNKSNHAALTLFKSPGTGRWTRVEGLASAKQLAEVWRDNVS